MLDPAPIIGAVGAVAAALIANRSRQHGAMNAEQLEALRSFQVENRAKIERLEAKASTVVIATQDVKEKVENGS